MARHALFETGIRRLRTKEKGFYYRYPDSSRTVREGKATLRRKHLRIESDTMIFEYTGV
jgi:DNA topoisomerase I